MACVAFIFLCGCKTQRKVEISEHEQNNDSLHKVTNVKAIQEIERWTAQRILADASSSEWTKIKIYDTSKEGNPLLIDIERRDTANISYDIQTTDSVEEQSIEEKTEDIEKVHKQETSYNKQAETIAEERISDIIRKIAQAGFVALILYGLFILYKKIK